MLILVPVWTNAQDQRVIDSLQQALRTTSGGDQYPFLYELAFQYLDRDNDKAFEFISMAEGAALLSGDSLWIANEVGDSASFYSINNDISAQQSKAYQLAGDRPAKERGD